ncbi:hypothetical protein FB45DRAFT_955181 [Roridomyces roridus]|uniref:F-box domain-containing protein n=1 Tax=Roridomyces roridus TaxID=1738132 RepID=A0AAD7AYZ8_9AGAR|nr:hypothetical protein FB45DRAFT_955181 [Roridomyces roridus]
MGAHDTIRRLNLTLKTFHDMSDLWAYTRDFPMLASFELQVDSAAPGRPIGLSMFKTAPALRRFCLNTPSCSLDLEPAAVPWSQLTELTLNLQVDLGTARSVLMECTRLEVCTIHTGGAAPTQLQHHSTFSFPNISELIVYAMELAPLALPNLYHRSHFRLVELELDVFEWTEADDSVDILDLLTYRGEDPAPFALPKLQSLWLRMDYSIIADPFTGSNDPSAAEMAESFGRYPGKRNRAFPSLTEVFLLMVGDRFDDDIEERLVKAGQRGGVVVYDREEEEE